MDIEERLRNNIKEMTLIKFKIFILGILIKELEKADSIKELDLISRIEGLIKDYHEN